MKKLIKNLTCWAMLVVIVAFFVIMLVENIEKLRFL